MNTLYFAISLIVLSWVSFAIGQAYALTRANRELQERRIRWLRYLPDDKESVTRHMVNETTKEIEL